MNQAMEHIENLTKIFAGARNELAERIGVLQSEQDAIRKRRIQGIRNAAQRFAAAHAELKEGIDSNRIEFAKPRTRIMHGIKVGMTKQRGVLKVSDNEACITALRRLLGEDAETYIKTTETPILSALVNLPAKDLKKIGATLSDDVDAVVIKPTDSEVDKLIKSLLNAADLEDLKP